MKTSCSITCAGFVVIVCLLTGGRSERTARAQESTPGRVSGGLLVLYDFSESGGPLIKDRSGVGPALDLRIADSKAVRRSNGSLQVLSKTAIQTDKPATRLAQAIRKSGEITIEAWIRPANTSQEGPARIVTMSRNPNERNFTLGQESDHLEVRFRTSRTSTNGIPSLNSERRSVTTQLTHIVYTRDRGGQTRLYLNGRKRDEQTVAGATSVWQPSLKLGLANEVTGDRPWLGTFFLVAIYSRDLSPQEVGQNFKAGSQASSGSLAQNSDPGARLFATKIAPLLSRQCLECHDSVSKKGGLDLSRKDALLAGGGSGKAVVAGKLTESLLWDLVESNEMPKKRPPLSDDEKKLLSQWIESGASWSGGMIDPAVYAHDNRATGIWIQRLTLAEYTETVRSAVGVDIEKEARDLLPPDLRADGFSNTAYNLNIDLKRVGAYAQLAEIIVSRMDVGAFAAQFSKSRRLEDDQMRDLVSKMGKWLFRGPLDDQEITNFRGISSTVASAGGGFDESVSFILEAMLQSPRFIYRIENQRGDGTAWPVGQYELASRLSYIIQGGPPDAELLKAADDGKLSDSSVIAQQAQRLLQDPRAIKRSVQFVDEWLNLGRLDNMSPNRKRFPDWDDQLARDMRDETRAFFTEVVWKQKRPLSDLLNAQVTFVTPRLAQHYGLKTQDSGVTDLSEVPGRGGLLTQGSVLTVGGDEASMVTRGLFVLHDLLRGVVKDPPPCVDTTPVPTKTGLTQRGIAEARIANVSCGGCHARFEPLAFGLEKFDGLGKFHEKDEHGNRLREDGEILFPGDAKPVAYKTSAELMNLLAGSDRIRESLTWKVAQFSLGRPLVAEDAPIIDRVHKSSQKNGGTWTSLITAIVTSDLVQLTRTESQ